MGLGLLCAAREALSLELLADLTGWSAQEGYESEQFVRDARQLLLEEPDSVGGVEAYCPRHEWVRELIIVDGDCPLVRFEPGTTYDKAVIALPGGTEGTVDRGIYAIAADADYMVPEIRALDSSLGVDFDMLLIRDKDPWPWLTSINEQRTGSSELAMMRDRVLAAFPTLRDTDLRQFFITFPI